MFNLAKIGADGLLKELKVIILMIFFCNIVKGFKIVGGAPPHAVTQ